MASHGVSRVQRDAARSKSSRAKEQQEIERYQAVETQFRQIQADGTLTEEGLGLTSKLLALNPEYYTVWNYRRRILLVFFSQASNGLGQQADVLIKADLDFILPLLIKFPKCYWIWNHRRWLLQQASERCDEATAVSFWQQEFGLVGKMLARDSRNFHGWSYRRRVVAELDKPSTNEEQKPLLTQQEFDYTTKMIGSNLSNFSAWHNRSKLIPKLLDGQNTSDAGRRLLFKQELDKVDEALAIDPYDQSLWYYHRFLMTEMQPGHATPFGDFSLQERTQIIQAELDSYKELLDVFDDCKWIQQNLIDFVLMLQDAGQHNVASPDDVQEWFESLERLDPLRKGRWRDLAARLSRAESR